MPAFHYISGKYDSETYGHLDKVFDITLSNKPESTPNASFKAIESAVEVISSGLGGLLGLTEREAAILLFYDNTFDTNTKYNLMVSQADTIVQGRLESNYTQVDRDFIGRVAYIVTETMSLAGIETPAANAAEQRILRANFKLNPSAPEDVSNVTSTLSTIDDALSVTGLTNLTGASLGQLPQSAVDKILDFQASHPDLYQESTTLIPRLPNVAVLPNYTELGNVTLPKTIAELKSEMNVRLHDHATLLTALVNNDALLCKLKREIIVLGAREKARN
ncbi:hypothetical protein FZEAL_10275 [Fusarium zealandicum]|uniref:Uncharacterized protein n=1 Tax=Fusarium zealandicum TaxID=1053134 RepID=A0A8H4U3W2_9HYPO|nr:hypothetical protein FZEAL_10275 [Fusarium zealandicum]